MIRALLPHLLLLAPGLGAPQDPPAPGAAVRDPAPAAPAYPRDPAARVALERALAPWVDGERAAAEVRALVRLGPRMGGTESGRRASEHRLRTFGELGLVARTIVDPQTWAHEQSSWRLLARAAAGGAGPVELELARAWPYGFSPSIEGTFPVSREAAPGVAHLRPRVVRGRRAEGSSPALALVADHVTTPGGYPKIEQLRAGDDNPYPIFGLASEESAWIEARLAEGAEVEVEARLVAKNQRASPLTVEARLAPRPGAAPGFLLFCAHGDSDAGGPGANDNGSGEAIVYEIARAWTAAIAAGVLEPPPREVRFAIWGKEIHSTRHYLATVVPADGPVLAVLNYDQAGFGSSAEQFHVEPDDLPANEELVRVLARLLAEHAGAPGFPARWATNKSLGGTDSYVFSGSRLFRELGTPALTLFTSGWDVPAEHPRTPGMPGESWSERDRVYVDYDAYYHSAGDLPENTTDREPHNMAWCARIGWLGALRWLEGRPPAADPGSGARSR